MTELHTRHCTPPNVGDTPLDGDAQDLLLPQLDPAWQLEDNRHALCRSFSFRDFHQVMAFINAVAWIAHREDHHPDMELGYNRCRIRYSTHAIGGLSENDFICAAKVDALLNP